MEKHGDTSNVGRDVELFHEAFKNGAEVLVGGGTEQVDIQDDEDSP